MGRMLCPAFFITYYLVFHSLSMAVNADNESEAEDESSFGYGSKTRKGPENWGNLNSKWKACKNGTLQSPIDLHDDHTVLISSTLGPLNRTYKPAPAQIINRGHDLMVEWKGDAGGITMNGTEYKLQQCHWHTPSEHSVRGKRFEMEIHMVHNNSLGQIAVTGIVYKLGRSDRFLAKLLHSIKTDDHNGTGLLVDPWEIKFGSRKYFRYNGSLTVPPCTEGVIWTILKKVRTVSWDQVRALRGVVHDGFEKNARPIQHLDGRAIYMYHP